MPKDEGISLDELNLILLLDNSYSMAKGRITQLNAAIPVLIGKLSEMADKNHVDLRLRVIAFSDEAVWKIGSIESGEDIKSVVWHDLDVVGGTSTPKAILEANKSLKVKYITHGGNYALRPVVILVTDGYCNDNEHDDYLAAIEEMKKRLSGNSGKEKVIRIAIGVEDYNRDQLVEFATVGIMSDVKQPFVFEVDKASDLGKVIQWTAQTSLSASMHDDNSDVIDIGDPDWGDDDTD